MQSHADILKQLVTMSAHLGQPEHEMVILGEGNTSARIDDETFWVKASGTRLPGCDESCFVRVQFDPVLKMLDGPDLSDEQIAAGLSRACVDEGAPRPSVETMLHAFLLRYPDVHFIGHTHPTAVNSILCSQNWHELFSGRLFPDEMVVCGDEYVLVPYTDPGLPLAKTVQEMVEEYISRRGTWPRVILIQNHGLIALGSTPAMVENISHMTNKTAKIILGACAAGGVNPLSQEHAERIATRPDEKYRKKGLDEA
ncbi:MAG: class II aldolase/adducin family protein [Armatimonadota bacterium]